MASESLPLSQAYSSKSSAETGHPTYPGPLRPDGLTPLHPLNSAHPSSSMTSLNHGAPSAPHGGAAPPDSSSQQPATGLRHGNFSRRRANHAVFAHKKDSLIEWIKSVLMSSFDLDMMDTQIPILLARIEVLVKEHVELGGDSRLARIVPDVPTLFTGLKLVKAFEIYNKKYRICSRRFVYPTFNEIRHILNLAQVLGLDSLKLMTFDGDQTLYPDQQNLEDPIICELLLTLLKKGVKIALVTAANYGLQVEKYEGRIGKLLEYFARQVETIPASEVLSPHSGGKNGVDSTPSESRTKISVGPALPKEFCKNFFIVAGESNFLLTLGENYKIQPCQEKWTACQEIPTAEPSENMLELLNVCEATLREGIADLNMTKATVLRKKTSVGVIVKSRELSMGNVVASYSMRVTPSGTGANAKLPIRMTTTPSQKKQSQSEVFPDRVTTYTQASVTTGYGTEDRVSTRTSDATRHDSTTEARRTTTEDNIPSTKSTEVAVQTQEVQTQEVAVRPDRGAQKASEQQNYYFRREQLDELVMRIQATLLENRQKINFPYCAFNGGNDVWFDIGNKKEGIGSLQKLLGISPHQCLHVGDQMARTGNDYMARFISPVCWIVNPTETKKILKHVVRKMGIHGVGREVYKDTVARTSSKGEVVVTQWREAGYLRGDGGVGVGVVGLGAGSSSRSREQQGWSEQGGLGFRMEQGNSSNHVREIPRTRMEQGNSLDRNAGGSSPSLSVQVGTADGASDSDEDGAESDETGKENSPQQVVEQQERSLMQEEDMNAALQRENARVALERVGSDTFFASPSQSSMATNEDEEGPERLQSLEDL